MSDDVTQRLAEIEARANAATTGPWRMYDGWGPSDDGYHRVLYIGSDDDLARVVDTEHGSEDVRIRKVDAEFIAHTREDVPWLIERLREAHATILVFVDEDDATKVKPCKDCHCALADHHKLRCENEHCPGGCNGWRCPEHGWILCGCTYAGGVEPATGRYAS